MFNRILVSALVGSLLLTLPLLAREGLSPAELTRIEEMIATGEASLALQQIDEVIESLHGQQGRFSAQLITPLTLRGDALVRLGEVADAIDSYGDARLISRQHYGLYDISQVDILYREAEAYYVANDILTANDRHEYAFSIYRQQFGTDSTKILPGLFRLADWYMSAQNVLTARGLYEKALNVSDQVLNDSSLIEARMDALEGLARTYRLEKFRPSVVKPKAYEFQPRPYGSITNPEHFYPTLNDFVEGEKALLELVRMKLQHSEATSPALAKAKLELADWYLLFEKHEKAAVVYEDIWRTLEDTDDFAFVIDNLMRPHVLYKPSPPNPEPPSGRTVEKPLEGRIEYSLTVTPEGKTKSIVQVTSEPGRVLEGPTKRSASESIFRPSFIDGVAVETENVPFIHTFHYFPDQRMQARLPRAIEPSLR